MMIQRSIDIEDEIRIILSAYMTAYCRPLPKDFQTPNILITQVGGTDAEGQIDTFDVVLDARAKDEATANETLRNAIGILRKSVKDHSASVRSVSVNSSGGWGSDPVRPDLVMFSARLSVVAHLEQKNIGGINQ